MGSGGGDTQVVKKETLAPPKPLPTHSMPKGQAQPERAVAAGRQSIIEGEPASASLLGAEEEENQKNLLG